jgi:hypothetical protein
MRKLRKLTRDFALLGIDFNRAASSHRPNPRSEEDFGSAAGLLLGVHGRRRFRERRQWFEAD